MPVVTQLNRCGEFARFLAKYGRADFVKDAAGTDAGIARGASTANAESFARDLEALGPTFIKLVGAAAGGIGLAWTIVAGDARKTRLQ